MAVEICVAKGLFEQNLRAEWNAGWRLLLTVALIRDKNPLRTKFIEVGDVRATRLQDNSDATLLTTLEQDTHGLTIYGFENSRFKPHQLIREEEFKKDEFGAGSRFFQRKEELRRLLIATPHGRLKASDADALLAEFQFRQHHRNDHITIRATKLLTLVLKQKP